jgi:hypothetical protein
LHSRFCGVSLLPRIKRSVPDLSRRGAKPHPFDCSPRLGDSAVDKIFHRYKTKTRLKGEFLLPLTPYHWGPCACLGLAFLRRLDPWLILLAGVVVDIEPFAVMVFGLDYPLHGLCHTFIFGTVIALALGVVWHYSARTIPWPASKPPAMGKSILTSFVGVYSHILLDAPLYADIKPFYPLQANPFYGMAGERAIYAFCRWSFVLAVVLLCIRIIMVKSLAGSKCGVHK